jgi:hypothetical protein
MAEGRIKLDLKGVSTGFEPLPAGKYLVKVAEAKEGVSNAGQPKVEMTFKVVAPAQYRGRNIWAHLSLQEKALFKFKGMLLALGFTKEDLDRDGIEIDLKELKGLEMGVKVKEREWNNQKTAEITQFLPAEDADEYEREDSEDTSWNELES